MIILRSDRLARQGVNVKRSRKYSLPKQRDLRLTQRYLLMLDLLAQRKAMTSHHSPVLTTPRILAVRLDAATEPEPCDWNRVQTRLFHFRSSAAVSLPAGDGAAARFGPSTQAATSDTRGAVWRFSRLRGSRAGTARRRRPQCHGGRRAPYHGRPSGWAAGWFRKADLPRRAEINDCQRNEPACVALFSKVCGVISDPGQLQPLPFSESLWSVWSSLSCGPGDYRSQIATPCGLQALPGSRGTCRPLDLIRPWPTTLPARPWFCLLVPELLHSRPPSWGTPGPGTGPGGPYSTRPPARLRGSARGWRMTPLAREWFCSAAALTVAVGHTITWTILGPGTVITGGKSPGCQTSGADPPLDDL